MLFCLILFGISRDFVDLRCGRIATSATKLRVLVAAPSTVNLSAVVAFEDQGLFRASQNATSGGFLVARDDGVFFQDAIAGVVEGKHVRVHRIALRMPNTLVRVEPNLHRHSVCSSGGQYPGVVKETGSRVTVRTDTLSYVSSSPGLTWNSGMRLSSCSVATRNSSRAKWDPKQRCVPLAKTMWLVRPRAKSTASGLL